MLSKGDFRLIVVNVYQNYYEYCSFREWHSAVSKNISQEKANRQIPISATQVQNCNNVIATEWNFTVSMGAIFVHCSRISWIIFCNAKSFYEKFALLITNNHIFDSNTFREGWSYWDCLCYRTRYSTFPELEKGGQSSLNSSINAS